MPDWFRSVDKADVSVIVPLYKSNLVIPDLVKSFSLDEKLKVEIIFIDDQEKYIRCLEKTALEFNIPYVGIHYTHLEEKVKNFVVDKDSMNLFI